MLDPRRLRAEPEAIAAQLARRGFALDLDRFRDLEARRELVAFGQLEGDASLTSDQLLRIASSI